MKKKVIRAFAWVSIIFSVAVILLMGLWTLNLVTLTKFQFDIIAILAAICCGIVLALCIYPKIE